MFTKSIPELQYSDIEDLVIIREEKEGHHLDYKREIGNPDKAKKELAKDITSFANAAGGYLIIGVDNNNKIFGVEPTIQNKSIDEWINQILSSNVEPYVRYFDPKIIKIPNSDKVIVVIYTPESTSKPHIVTEWNNYFVRINDSCKIANHQQIRDMFEFSRNRVNEFNAFLQKRNLLDEESSNFGINNNSKKLYSEIPLKTNSPKPHVLFSLVPKYLGDEKVKLSARDFKIWLEQNCRGYYPYPSMSLFHLGYDNDLKLDGIIINHTQSKELTSYFEVLNNGFIETGMSTSIMLPFVREGKPPMNFLMLTELIGYEMLLLGFAKKFYESIKYYDEVLLQISFVNVLHYKLYGFHHQYGDNIRYEWNDISNKHHNNFKLTYSLNSRTLSDENILLIAKQHSEKLCRVFGLDYDYCFVNDDLSIRELQRFRL